MKLLLVTLDVRQTEIAAELEMHPTHLNALLQGRRRWPHGPEHLEQTVREAAMAVRAKKDEAA